MALTLVIGNYNYSSWSLRAWIFLRHFHVPFTTVRIALDQPDTLANLAQHSPSKKVQRIAAFVDFGSYPLGALFGPCCRPISRVAGRWKRT
jgi:hypothetical protein